MGSPCIQCRNSKTKVEISSDHTLMWPLTSPKCDRPIYIGCCSNCSKRGLECVVPGNSRRFFVGPVSPWSEHSAGTDVWRSAEGAGEGRIVVPSRPGLSLFESDLPFDTSHYDADISAPASNENSNVSLSKSYTILQPYIIWKSSLGMCIRYHLLIFVHNCILTASQWPGWTARPCAQPYQAEIQSFNSYGPSLTSI